MVAIIDYDAGNMRSVEKALAYLGEEVVITRKQQEIRKAEHVILPGVGAYGDAMEKLRKYDLINAIKETVNQGTPFLGICLGLQLLFQGSEENGGIEGLSLMRGNIVGFKKEAGLKIPHIGWNSLEIRPAARLYQGIENQSHVYFVHSYYLEAQEEDQVSATSRYAAVIHASVERENLFACQFHPEKSGETGLRVLKNFASIG